MVSFVMMVSVISLYLTRVSTSCSFDSRGHGRGCVAAAVSHRASFNGLADSDPVRTREYVATLTVSEQGLMRKALNGALFTNDSVCHFSSSGTTACQFCGEEDSRKHRFWQCKVFDIDRMNVSPDFWQHFESDVSTNCLPLMLR